ncbi:MAG TPA: hypothetical protein VFV95_06795 [Vicinamibacterales bacterium]|nr:hypothetical protein [Vicinamibacterales bacterium]
MTDRNARRGAIVKIVLIMLIFAATLGTLTGLASRRLSQPVRVGITTVGISLAGAFLRHRYRDALGAK